MTHAAAAIEAELKIKFGIDNPDDELRLRNFTSIESACLHIEQLAKTGVTPFAEAGAKLALAGANLPHYALAVRPKPYTILLLRPDHMSSSYGQDTFMTHVVAFGAKDASLTAKLEAVLTDCEEEWREVDPEDYFVHMVIAGHHQDINGCEDKPENQGEASAPELPAGFTPLQTFVAQNYEGGEFSHITSLPELDQCGDTLFKFCILEAGNSANEEDLMRMIDQAQAQLRSLAADLMDFTPAATAAEPVPGDAG